MSLLRNVPLDTEERDAYRRHVSAIRRSPDIEEAEIEKDTPEEEAAASLSDERLAELQAKEEFVLSVSEDGLGKRTSAYSTENISANGVPAATN